MHLRINRLQCMWRMQIILAPPNLWSEMGQMLQLEQLSAQHPLGRSYIKDQDGNDVNLRLNAAVKRVRNNSLCGVDDIEVIDLDSKVSSSKCSSVTDVGIEDRVQWLKVKAMHDIKHGSLPTKVIAKQLFCKHQNMGRDAT